MRRSATVFLALGLVTAACGGDSGAPTSSATSSPTTVAETTTTGAPSTTTGTGDGFDWMAPIEAGICFDDVWAGEDFDFDSPAAVVPCDGPHDNEVVAMIDLPAGDYPGEDALFESVELLCAVAYSDFFGGTSYKDWMFTWDIVPIEEAWDGGSRQAACVTYSGEPTRGTARSGDLTAPGEELAVLHEVDGQLDVWLLDGGTGELTLNVSNSPTSIQTSPPGWGFGGQAVAWAQGDTEPDRRLFGAAPGGEVMAFSDALDVDAIGSPAVNHASPRFMAVIAAPDGGEFDVFVYDGETDTLTNLTADNPDRDSTPNWSPDGTKIAYRARIDGNSDIWVMDEDGSNKVRITTDPGFDGDPRWSPDGNHILFTSDRTGDYEIWIMDADGSNQRNLTNHPADDEYPAWSPDGSLIAFHSNRHGGLSLWIMAADGSDQSNLSWWGPVGYPAFRP